MRGPSTLRSNTNKEASIEAMRCDRYLTPMQGQPPPETILIRDSQVACDGVSDTAPALGHPRVFLRIDPAVGFVECGYCDRRFVLRGGPADSQIA